MKWIGQHIWDFISRFRTTVYIENLETSSEENVLVVDSDGKVTKNTTLGGSDVTMTDGVDNRVMTATGAAAITGEANFTFNGSSLALTGVMDISPANNAGAPALLIDNDDVDQIALSIDAANTTADIISVTGNALTSGSFIDYTGVATGVNLNGLIDIDITNTDTTTTNSTGISIDYNKSGVTAASQFAVFTGINIDYDDTATNDAAGNSVVKGMVININNDSDQGAIYQTGLEVWCTGADAASASGIMIRTPNGANDLRIISQDSAADIFTIDTKEDGETTLTTIENGGGSTAHMNLVADGDIVLDSASGVIKTGSTTFVNNSGVIQVAGQTNITSVGTLTGLTTSGAIELGHADDTTIARSSAGVVTVQGKTVALGTELAGHNENVILKQVKVTLSKGDVNGLHTTPIQLVAAQGANTIIVFSQAIMRVTRALTQNQSACDMTFHYDGQEPGTNFSESVMFLRRFMYNELGDRTYSLMPIINGHIAQNLTDTVNKALEVSLDSAALLNSTNGTDIWLTYYVIDIS